MTVITSFTLIISTLFGFCLGSFIHLVIYRFTPNKSTKQFLHDITFKSSYCPACKKKLKPWQLLPIISWIIAKGHCYYCHASIPWHYLFIEVFTGLFVSIIIAYYGLSIKAVMHILIAGYFFILAMIDIRHYLLPDILTQPLMWLGLLLAYFHLSKLTLEMAFTGVSIGYLLLWLPAFLYSMLRGKNGLGGGDIKLFAALGAWVDYTKLPTLLLISALLGLLYFALINLLTTKRPKVIPFGPCLLMAGYFFIESSF